MNIQKVDWCTICLAQPSAGTLVVEDAQGYQHDWPTCQECVDAVDWSEGITVEFMKDRQKAAQASHTSPRR